MKRKILLISIISTLCSAFFLPINQTNKYTYAMGFPIKFIWFRDFNGMPKYRFLIFSPKNFVKTEFNLFFFLLCCLIIYTIIYFSFKMILKQRMVQ